MCPFLIKRLSTTDAFSRGYLRFPSSVVDDNSQNRSKGSNVSVESQHPNLTGKI